MPEPWKVYWSKTEHLFLIGWQDSNYRIAAADDWHNACLIAAAPEMYNLLNGMKGELLRMDGGGFSGGNIRRQIVDKIEAVLQKARGEA